MKARSTLIALVASLLVWPATLYADNTCALMKVPVNHKAVDEGVYFLLAPLNGRASPFIEAVRLVIGSTDPDTEPNYVAPFTSFSWSKFVITTDEPMGGVVGLRVNGEPAGELPVDSYGRVTWIAQLLVVFPPDLAMTPEERAAAVAPVDLAITGGGRFLYNVVDQETGATNATVTLNYSLNAGCGSGD